MIVGQDRSNLFSTTSQNWSRSVSSLSSLLAIVTRFAVGVVAADDEVACFALFSVAAELDTESWRDFGSEFFRIDVGRGETAFMAASTSSETKRLWS